MLHLLQEDASNTTTLGLLLECSLPKTLFNNPQVIIDFTNFYWIYLFNHPLYTCPETLN